MPVSVVVQFTAAPESRDAFQTVMEGVKTDLPNVPGCLGVTILQHIDEPGSFTLIETWESRDNHQTHVEALVADGTWARIKSLLASAPVSGYFRQI